MPNPFIALIGLWFQKKSKRGAEEGEGSGSLVVGEIEDFLSRQQPLYLYLLYLLD